MANVSSKHFMSMEYNPIITFLLYRIILDALAIYNKFMYTQKPVYIGFQTHVNKPWCDRKVALCLVVIV